MKMGKYVLAVLTRPVKGREDEYNNWYTERHLDDVLAVPGFSAAQRFKIKGDPVRADPFWSYLAIYEMDVADPRTALDEMMRRSETDRMPISEAMDQDLYCVVYEPITVRRVAKE
jgi:hypothetical protein